MGFALMTPTLTLAEETPPNVKKVDAASSFAENKAEMLKHLNEQLDDAQQGINCVQAANDHEAMRACAEQRAAKQQSQQGTWGGSVSPVGRGSEGAGG